VALIVGGVAAPAAAHAVLVDSSPYPTQLLATSPNQLSLRFSEPVDAGLGAIRLYDEQGTRLDLGAPERPRADVVAVPIPERLVAGSYVVTWRVVSADSHPIRGGFTFRVGTGSDATGPTVESLARRLVDEQSGDTMVGALFGASRAGVFAGFAVLIGAALFCVAVAPAHRTDRSRRIIWTAWTVLAASTLTGLLLQGPYGAGAGLAKTFDPGLLAEVLGARYGQAWALRLVVLVLAVPVLRRLLADQHAIDRPRRLELGAAVIAVALALTVTMSGHAAAGRWVAVAIPIDVAHLLAMASWLGGLVILIAEFLPSRDRVALRRCLPCFSRLAFVAVGVLVVTGTVQAIRQVGSVDALTGTDFGRLLIIKVGLVALVLVSAFRSRTVVQRFAIWLAERRRGSTPAVGGGSEDHNRDSRTRGADDGEWFDEAAELRVLRTSVVAEGFLAAGVIVVAALLVNAVPARTASSLSAGGATGTTLKSAVIWVDVTAAPARAGANDVHVFALEANGAPTAVQELTLTIELPRRGIAPIDVPLRRLGPDHYYAPGFDIPIAGTWRVTARARISDFDQATLTGKVSIR